jgi:predicted enzyme related to lactoylglutathione lyase
VRPPAKAKRRTAARKPARSASAPAAAAVPNAIGLVLHHLDFTTHAQDEVRRFYVDVLGFSQSRYDDKNHYLFIQTAPGASIGFMPPMPGPPEEWRPPREPAIYFFVTDVDRAYRELAAKGVSFDGEPMDAPWGHRIVLLRDPEGRRVCLAQPLPERG